MSIIGELKAWIWTCAMCMPGRIGERLRAFLISRKAKVGSGFVSAPWSDYLGCENIVFGEKVMIGSRCTISSQKGRLRFGSRVVLNTNVFVGADFGEIEIGDDVLIGPNVVLRAADHDISKIKNGPLYKQGHVSGKIKIGSNVWLAANCFVRSGVTIGDGAVIAAGAVVLNDIPAGAVAGGVPAKVLKQL
jgi:galactoside O-acetyltransferase